eukprot:scaffold1535_cov382-Prasinococcus_capsulatus_cf.AAC.53
MTLFEAHNIGLGAAQPGFLTAQKPAQVLPVSDHIKARGPQRQAPRRNRVQEVTASAGRRRVSAL